jgi:peptidoglycan/LPS O-acetylase OafA/YrhL
VEEHFYLLWPFLLVLCGERRARRFVLPVALLFAIWRSFEFRHQLLMSVLPGSGFYSRTDIRLDALLFGCWAALLFKLWRAPLARVSPAHLSLAAVLFIACVIIQPPMAMLWQSLLIPVLLVGTVLHPKSYVGMLLETPVLRWIGRLSYSLYLWQQLFLVPHDIPRPVPLGFLQQWPWNLAAVFLFATASYYLIEVPMIRFGRRVTAPQQQPGWASVYDHALSPQ